MKNGTETKRAKDRGETGVKGEMIIAKCVSACFTDSLQSGSRLCRQSNSSEPRRFRRAPRVYLRLPICEDPSGSRSLPPRLTVTQQILYVGHNLHQIKSLISQLNLKCFT